MQGGRPETFDVAQAVADHPKLAAGGDGGILLPQRARGAVARVGKRRLAVFDQCSVEGFEVGEPEEHLAADLEDVGYRIALGGRQLFGDVVDGARVVGDVLAGAAVAAGRRAHQPAVAVDQRQRDTVDLEFAQIRHVVADLGADARRPQVEFLGAEHVVEGQHPFQVLGRGEVGGKAGAADELGRRIRCAQLGMLVLECGQSPQQLVEVRVGDDRRVAHVVAELMFAHLVGEFAPLPAHVGGDGVVIGRTHPRRLSSAPTPFSAARLPWWPCLTPRTQP